MLLGLVGLGAAACVVLISASIVIELIGDRTPHTDAPVLTPAQIAACRRDVAGLLEGLLEESARVQVAGADRGASWDAFGARWDDSWHAVDERCRFGELAERGLGAAYDRAAAVHRSLPRTRLKVGHLLTRYARDLADEVAGMRRALEDSK